MSAVFDDEKNVVSGTLNIGSGNIYDIVLSDTSGEPTIFNQNMLDIDFAVSGTGQGDVFYYDASLSRLGLNVTDPDAAFHIVTDCALDGLKIENITNCATGVRLLLAHNSQTAPNVGDYPATIDLAGRDTSYVPIKYGQIRSKILSPTNGSTSGEILFTVDHTGVNKEVFRSSLLNTVLGGLNEASGQAYNVIGYNNTASGLSYIVLGNLNDVTTSTGILIGNNNEAEGDKLLIVSNDSQVSGNYNIAFLVDSTVSGLSNVAIGNNIGATGDNNIIIGNSNDLHGDNFVGLISNFYLEGQSGIGFGIDGYVSGDKNIYIGSDIFVSGHNDIVIGSNVNVTGDNNIVYGNTSNASGNHIISIGIDNQPTNINSGIYIGNDIDLSDSVRSIVIGLGTHTTSGLDDSLLIGIDNSTLDGMPTGLVIVGQHNTVSQIKESLIVGNSNNLSGNVANNIVVGPRNNVPLTSNNNLVVGILNNTSGIVINTDGSIVGDDAKTDGDRMSNSSVFGINNWVSNASGTLIFGNKVRTSGLNINNFGSYSNLNGENIQNLGNSNFTIGDHNVSLGRGNDILGDESLSFNTSSSARNQIFGNQSIVLGHNEVVISGIALGFENELYGTNNLIMGKNNTVGFARFPCRASGTEIVIQGDVRSYFNDGDRVLVGILSPASQSESIYDRIILDADGVVLENDSNGLRTLLNLNSSIVSLDTIEYYIKNNFDDVVHGLNPCEECFASTYAGYSSGYVVVTQDGNDEDDLIGSPRYGANNIVIGYNNIQTHSSGLVLGHNNNISGVNHLAIGHNLSGYYNNTIQIGTNNDNKIIIDNTKIVFNTGEFQSQVYFHSSNPDTEGNDLAVVNIDLSNNRVGVNTTDPRSTLDVSGLLTADRLRVKLTGVAGYSLISDDTGEATWQFPVNLSGQNSGLIFKIDDKIGSGLREFIFNTGTREISYLRVNTDQELPEVPIDDSTNIGDEKCLIISSTGMFLNAPGSDYGYDFIVRGSGIQAPVNGDASVYLIKTMVPENAVRVYNITGVSGHFDEFTISSGIIAPVSLTGTILSVTDNGEMISTSYPKYSMIYTEEGYAASGSQNVRYYPGSQAITIGLTGTPPLAADSALQQGSSNTFNHIILGSNNGTNTVFNNAGTGGNMFIVAASGGGGDGKRGLQFHANSGNLGIGVAYNDQQWQSTDATTNRYWWETAKLVVDGRIRAKELQLTPLGKASENANAINQYLKIVDNYGTVGLDTIDLSYQFSGIFPLKVETSESEQKVNISISEQTKGGVSLLGDTSNGLMLVYDGDNWVHNRGMKLYQPAASTSDTDTTHGIEFGNKLKLNSCNNNHVFGAGSFASPGSAGSALDGSSQLSRFYLRGATDSSIRELVSNFHKDTNITNNGSVEVSANADNTISLIHDYDNNQSDHDKNIVWHFTVNYSAIFSNNNTTPTFGAAAGEIKGAVISYVDASDNRVTSLVGSNSEIHKTYSSVDYSSTDPITVTVDTGPVTRLKIVANPTTISSAATIGYWSCVVDINQVFMPSGMNFANGDIT